MEKIVNGTTYGIVIGSYGCFAYLNGELVAQAVTVEDLYELLEG